MTKEQTRQERLKVMRQNILDSGRPNGYEYIEEYLVELENNWNELKMYFKKETIDLELIKEGISIDDYIDRKSFLSEVLNKIEEIESRK